MITITFLAEWALRSSALILCGALLLQALRVKDPAIRLLAWTALLIGSLAIPALHRAAPRMSVPVQRDFTATLEAPPLKSETHTPIQQQAQPIDWPFMFLMVWAAVSATLLLRLLIGMVLSLRLLRRSRSTEIGVRESDDLSAPVTLGIVKPVIVLPRNWREWPHAKLEAVLAHERSHIRRLDPAVQLLSAIHRAILWHSPLSWYLHTRIVRVAEEASDDAALRIASDRPLYAEVLLEFMRTGVRGAGRVGVPMARYGRLEARIHRVLDGTVLSRGLTRGRFAGVLVGVLMVTCPLVYAVAAAGLQTPKPAAAPTPPPQAQVQPAAKTTPVFHAEPGYLRGQGTAVPSSTVTLRSKVDGMLTAVNLKEGVAVEAGQVLATVQTSTDWQKEKKASEQELAQLESDLSAAYQPAAKNQYKERIKAQKAVIEEFSRRLEETVIRTPVSGITGLLQIDPGNIVHPNDRILVITQLEPMAVLFTIPEEKLGPVLARLHKSEPARAEAWDRANSTRIASGHLVAVDNQIDPNTGMAKLKAIFENKNGALFPNQFVNVRLFLNQE
jgi:multidrug efflux pump subunit AcrA (membrane-fusion protein)